MTSFHLPVITERRAPSCCFYKVYRPSRRRSCLFIYFISWHLSLGEAAAAAAAEIAFKTAAILPPQQSDDRDVNRARFPFTPRCRAARRLFGLGSGDHTDETRFSAGMRGQPGSPAQKDSICSAGGYVSTQSADVSVCRRRLSQSVVIFPTLCVIYILLLYCFNKSLIISSAGNLWLYFASETISLCNLWISN